MNSIDISERTLQERIIKLFQTKINFSWKYFFKINAIKPLGRFT